jgi:hypothetical protein
MHDAVAILALASRVGLAKDFFDSLAIRLVPLPGRLTGRCAARD